MNQQYKERVKAQTLKWAMGQPYHNNIDDECCPDFSCCKPEMFEQDETKRWEYYRNHHGLNS
jgi:hypothetical protein